MKGHESPAYRFGAFLLVPGERALLHDGEPVVLAAKRSTCWSRWRARPAIW